MNNTMRWSVLLPLLSFSLLAAPRFSGAEKLRVPPPPHPPYSLIRNTSSPSHRYVMAWGVKDKKVDWHLLENSHSDRAESYFWKLISDEEQLQNYIVDRKTKRILGIVPLHHRSFHLYGKRDNKISTSSAGGDYWSNPGGGSKNHVEVSTYWLKDESMAVLYYGGE